MRLSRLVSFVAVALGAVVYVALLLPPVVESASFTPRTQWPVVKGAYHVHSERSDGTGTSDDIAAAAARAGLQFVILTDHGNGTRPPQPPA